jgi:hypothetical protein
MLTWDNGKYESTTLQPVTLAFTTPVQIKVITAPQNENLR